MNTVPKYILWTLAIVIGAFLVWYFSDIVSYILISAVMAIVGKPIVDMIMRVRVHRYHPPQWLAAAVTLLLIWAGLLIFFVAFIPSIFSKVSEYSSFDIQHLVETFREPIAALQNFLGRVFSIRRSDFSLADSLTHNLNDFLNIGALNDLVSSAVSTVGSTVVALFAISFITFFFLKEDQMFVNMVVAIFPPKYENNIRHAMASVTNLLMRYFTGLLIESTIIILLVSSAMLLWGMSASNAFFIGFLMGILNVIPYIGPLIGAALSILIGIMNPLDGFTAGQMAMAIGFTVLGLKMCDDFILQPLLYSKRVKAHPLEIFLVILLAGSLAGVVGMLLAIPSYNVIRVFAKEFLSKFQLVRKLTDKI